MKLSFEFFPPKNAVSRKLFENTVERLKVFQPEYMSVTYGALGSQQNQTLEMVDYIQNMAGVEAAAHFTCIGSSLDKVHTFVADLQRLGVRRMVALRGDIPEGVETQEVLSDLKHASDLVAFMSEHYPDMHLSVAGYPEGHPEAVSLDEDLKQLKYKVDQGASVVITQLFFDNQFFIDFRNRARTLGLDCKIIPGIMPVTQYRMIERITQMCGVHIPKALSDFFAKDKSDEEVQSFAKEFTLKQCLDLKEQGVAEIHFYTLNQAKVVEDVCCHLKGDN